MTGQDAASAEQNAEFFARDKHGRDVAELDTYRLIREAITREVAGTERLLDVGNGGVFEYDTDAGRRDRRGRPLPRPAARRRTSRPT